MRLILVLFPIIMIGGAAGAFATYMYHLNKFNEYVEYLELPYFDKPSAEFNAEMHLSKAKIAKRTMWVFLTLPISLPVIAVKEIVSGIKRLADIEGRAKELEKKRLERERLALATSILLDSTNTPDPTRDRHTTNL